MISILSISSNKIKLLDVDTDLLLSFTPPKKKTRILCCNRTYIVSVRRKTRQTQPNKLIIKM